MKRKSVIARVSFQVIDDALIEKLAAETMESGNIQLEIPELPGLSFDTACIYRCSFGQEQVSLLERLLNKAAVAAMDEPKHLIVLF